MIALCFAIGLVTLAVYAQTAHHGFILLDDNDYVYSNTVVKTGLTASAIVWAFRSFSAANWHPVTWISHMADVQFFGMNAAAHHLSNVFFHVASSLWLFLALVRLTQRPWRSAVAAGIFALHPLHVESVAWIAERKDVLSAFFANLTLFLYAGYATAPTGPKYAALLLTLALGLMSKPMLVTFPFVLLLIDFWPLRRLERPLTWSKFKPLLFEKTPMFAMAAISSVLTFLAQRGVSVIPLAALSLSVRFSNAAVAYVAYILKALWPVNLAVLYPYEIPPAGEVAAALTILVALSLLCLGLVQRYPYLLVGWLWYLGMLVPVIGIVQVGVQSLADRYMYLPLTGLSIGTVWLVADFARDRPLSRQAVGILTGLLFILLAIRTYQQAAYWKDNRTLFEHTLSLTSGNYIILNDMGVVLADEGNRDKAIAYYRDAVRFSPIYAEAQSNLGHQLVASGKLGEAFPYVQEALRLKPSLVQAHGDMGLLLAAQGKFEEASYHLSESLRSAPDNPTDQSNLCYVLQRMGRFADAVTHCNEALRINPESPDARYNLGTALAAQGRKAEAAAEFTRVLAKNPNHADAHAALEQVQSR